MGYEQLKLQNQLCFPAYAASRLIIREYKPELDKLGITYPQYLVLMILWEEDCYLVNDIAKKLVLNTNTVTPLLKRMEAMGLITREKSREDERKVNVCLTPKGKRLEDQAAHIPKKLSANLLGGSMGLDELIQLKKLLDTLVSELSNKK